MSPPPPAIAFQTPLENSSLHGAVPITVTATGAAEIASLKLVAPVDLASATAAYDPSSRSATLTASLDLARFPDGPLKISASAHDALGGTSSKDLTVTVAQHAPEISINSPSDQSAVTGTTALVATAAAQSGSTIVSFDVVNAPSGVGPDSLPAADAVARTWNTARAPEGLTPLTFRAVDSTGLVADKTIHVIVDNIPFGAVTAQVSAGAPIAGATVYVYAVDDSGEVRADVGSAGLLGSGGPTNPAGIVAITLTGENYVGPVRITASGSSLSYSDPTDPSASIALPSDFQLTTVLPSYTAGTSVTVPVSLYTTLADAEAVAFAKGLHPAHRQVVPFATALTTRDPLFERHLTNTPNTWNLRATAPASLTTAPQTLRDVVYAALFDVALNQLARDLAQQAGFGTSTSVINAVSLTKLLLNDLAPDARFDGLGEGGQQLSTPGATPVALSANTLRAPLATALDRWMLTASNKTGLTRTDLTNARVYDTISNDVSDLFGPENPLPFDNQGPSVTVSVAFGSTNRAPVGAEKLVSGLLTVQADASDSAGIATLRVTINGSNVVRDELRSTPTHFVGTVDSKLFPDGSLTFLVTATDSHQNTGTTSYSVSVDNTAPTINEESPAPSKHYGQSVDLITTAADSNGVASLTATGLPQFADNDGSPGRIFGTWTIPSSISDGAASYTLEACDVVGNCRALARTINVDRTPPVITAHGTLPGRVTSDSLALSLDATDAGAGVGRVFVQNGNGAVLSAARQGTTNTWNVTVPLTPGPNKLAFWGEDLAVPVNNGAVARSSVTVEQDTSGPGVSVQVTFANGWSPVAVGTTFAVAGTLTITADATDTGALASLSAAVNGTPALRDPARSTATHLVANYATALELDGPLTVTVVAEDDLGNRTTRTVPLVLDNTPPAITRTLPGPAVYYSSTVPFDATATDASPIKSLTLAGVTGAADTDTTAAHFAALWTIPANSSDGSLPYSFTACDALENCATSSSNTMLDRSPPTVTLASAPSALTSASSVTLSINAADLGAGVGAVYAQAGSGSPVTAVRVGTTNTWHVSVPLAEGANTLSYWAVDAASPPNSGDTAKSTVVVTRDSTPPSLNVAVVYRSNLAPVGASRLVAGTVTVTVDARDVHATSSINATATSGASTLSFVRDNAASSATHYIGTFNTTSVPDGALTITVTAQDELGSVATSTYAVTVDNTPPALSIANPPAGAYYAGAVPLDVTATDANGVLSCGELTYGAADADSAAAHYVAAFNPQGGDGALTFQFQGCDVVGNCAPASRTVYRDTTPPTVAFVSAPPAYTKTASLTFTVSAQDGGAGVASVKAQIDGVERQGNPSGGQYWFTIDRLGADGPKSVVVWAVDSAGNGGPATGISTTVVLDTTNPAPSIEADVASYFDERSMTLTAPSVPPSYAYPSGASKIAVANTKAIYKASSRLGAGSAGVSGAVLEGNNPDNLPFIQFSIATEPSAAPITGATYSIQVAGEASPYTGNLLAYPSPSSTPSKKRYDLPLSLETIPSLITTQGSPLTLTISATFTDAAGNSGPTPSVEVLFYVVPPPLWVKQDDQYPSRQDPKSPHPYSLANRSYTTFWSDSTRFPGMEVRLLRYRITNPTSVPVAVSASFTGTATQTESYVRSLGTQQVSPDGGNDVPWDGYQLKQQTRAQNQLGQNIWWTPCSLGDGSAANPNLNPVHVIGDTGTQWSCLPESEFPWITTSDPGATGTASWSRSSSLFRTTFRGNPNDTATEPLPPDTAGGAAGSGFIVPAASGGSPGEIVVYVARAFSARSIPDGLYAGYEDAIAYRWASTATGGCCGYRVFDLFAISRRITSAAELLSGTMSVTAYPVGTSGATIGTSLPRFQESLNNSIIRKF